MSRYGQRATRGLTILGAVLGIITGSVGAAKMNDMFGSMPLAETAIIVFTTLIFAVVLGGLSYLLFRLIERPLPEVSSQSEDG